MATHKSSWARFPHPRPSFTPSTIHPAMQHTSDPDLLSLSAPSPHLALRCNVARRAVPLAAEAAVFYGARAAAAAQLAAASKLGGEGLQQAAAGLQQQAAARCKARDIGQDGGDVLVHVCAKECGEFKRQTVQWFRQWYEGLQLGRLVATCSYMSAQGVGNS